MKPALKQANLLSDLDADGHKILNLPADQPLPPPNIPVGAIIDVHINATAGIQQSKLALTGDIPPSFLGTTDTTAAQGDLAEYTANKAQPSGYASLDSGGKIPTSQMPALAGTGTVTSVSVATANGVSGTVANANTTPAITLDLGNITPTSIAVDGTAGNGSISLAAQSSPPSGTQRLWAGPLGRLNMSFDTNGFHLAIGAPSLSADHFVDFPNKDGVVAYISDLAGTMVGVGGSHSGGLVIDTGASGAGTDYLARDATWKSPSTFSAPTYQPICAPPVFFPSANATGPKTMQIGFAGMTGTNLYYEIGSNTGPFLPYTNPNTFSLAPGEIVYAYQAKAGYTNSAMAAYVNPNSS